jgi:hypothetical protein
MNSLKLTPEIFLYMKGVEDYKKLHGREPDEAKKMEMFLVAKDDFKNTSYPVKIKLKKHVEMLNEMAESMENYNAYDEILSPNRQKRKSKIKVNGCKCKK